MIAKYKSDFPNQLQQLNVSISKHYHLLKDGTIKWQEKQIDVDRANYRGLNKRLLVTYIIRDHYSSCFYAELHPTDSMPRIEDFLYNAWQKKDHYEFCGIGYNIIVPKITLDLFPQLNNFFSNVDKVNLQLPSSGFNSAVRSIREWEKKIKSVEYFISDTEKLEGFQNKIDEINRLINSKFYSERSNLKKWAENNPKILLPRDKESFYSYFQQR